MDDKLARDISKSVSCGGCGVTISVSSAYSCARCGRMLCRVCGTIVGTCKNHVDYDALNVKVTEAIIRCRGFEPCGIEKAVDLYGITDTFVNYSGDGVTGQRWVGNYLLPAHFAIVKREIEHHRWNWKSVYIARINRFKFYVFVLPAESGVCNQFRAVANSEELAGCKAFIDAVNHTRRENG